MRNITLLLIVLTLSISNAFAQSIANYNISIITIWNTTEHTSLPNNAHWSPLVGGTHKNANDILEFGVTAPLTNGVKDVAEIGVNTNFENEINTLISTGNANQYLEQAFSPTAGNNSSAAINNVSVSEDFPLITLISMVAPSPDWFIAVNSLNLRSGNNEVNNGWKDTFSIDVYAYDAGTDSGTDYTSTDMISNPRTPISMISGFPINGNRMASITFQYNSSTTLNVSNNTVIKRLKAYPNPSKGKITISNIHSTTINNLKIYNVLGSLVKDVVVKNGTSEIDIDVSNLKKGMYLVSFTNNNGTNKTEKIIIN